MLINVNEFSNKYISIHKYLYILQYIYLSLLVIYYLKLPIPIALPSQARIS